MRRTVNLFTLLFLSYFIANAQEEFKKPLSGIKQIKIEANTDVTLIVGNTNELVLSFAPGKDEDGIRGFYSTENQEEKKEKIKGLKPIYAGGVDNTGIGFLVEQEGDVLRLKDLKPFIQRENIILKLPKNIDVYLDCGSLGNAHIDGFSSEIVVNTNVGEIELVNVTGPITAHSSTGDINVTFTTVAQKTPISITTATADIDVSLPASSKADLELKTTMGTVYTDFDLEIPREDGLKTVGAKRKIESKLNSGGVKIVLQSSTGNVYLRKSK